MLKELLALIPKEQLAFRENKEAPEVKWPPKEMGPVYAERAGERIDDKAERKVPHTINEQYEGQKHPDTGVEYKREVVTLPDGTEVEGVFPEFPPEYETTLDKNENGNYEGSRPENEKECYRKLKEAVEKDPELREKFTEEQLEQIANGETPDGYTWHHHQEPGRMQLVDSKTHGETRHTGGYSIWGSGE